MTLEAISAVIAAHYAAAIEGPRSIPAGRVHAALSIIALPGDVSASKRVFNEGIQLRLQTNDDSPHIAALGMLSVAEGERLWAAIGALPGAESVRVEA